MSLWLLDIVSGVPSYIFMLFETNAGISGGWVCFYLVLETFSAFEVLSNGRACVNLYFPSSFLAKLGFISASPCNICIINVKGV